MTVEYDRKLLFEKFIRIPGHCRELESFIKITNKMKTTIYIIICQSMCESDVCLPLFF